MTDQSSKALPATPPYGLRPETWAAAEYDAIRESINSLLAETMAGIDYCEDWIYNHEVVVGAGGSAWPNLLQWVRNKLRDHEDLDDQLRRLRDTPMALELRSKALDDLSLIVRRAVFEQWPTHLDSAELAEAASPAIISVETPAGTDRG